MKTFRILAALMMAVMCVSLSSCSSDDDYNDETNSGVSKHITQIKSTHDYFSYTISMNYKDNRLSKFIWTYDNHPNDYEVNQSITCANNKVIITGIVDGYECEQTYIINNEGYATSCSIPDIKGKKVEIVFEYTKEGYLTKAIEMTKNSSETRNNTYSFAYSNGNIIQGKDSHISGSIYTQSYSNHINQSGLIDYAMLQLLYNYQTAFYYGILGKPCKYLPSSCKETEVCEMGWSATYDFMYEHDNKNYVTKTIIAASDGDTEVMTYSYE